MTVQKQVLFEVGTQENLEANVEDYKFYRRLTIEKLKELVNRLLDEMEKGIVVGFNISPSEEAEL